MLISVIYQNGRHDMVKDFMLGKLIETAEIIQFKRKDGWVDINKDKVRGKDKINDYELGRRNDEIQPLSKLSEIF